MKWAGGLFSFWQESLVSVCRVITAFTALGKEHFCLHVMFLNLSSDKSEPAFEEGWC